MEACKWILYGVSLNFSNIISSRLYFLSALKVAYNNGTLEMNTVFDQILPQMTEISIKWNNSQI